MFIMADYVREMTVGQTCEYGKAFVLRVQLYLFRALFFLASFTLNNTLETKLLFYNHVCFSTLSSL